MPKIILYKKLLIAILFLGLISCNAQTFKGFDDETVIKKQLAIILPKYTEINPENVTFRKRKQIIPLTSVPSVFNIFRAKKNWKYHINLSTGSSITKLNKIIYDSLSYDAQTGVIAHELGHVADFQNHSRWYLLEILIGHLSSKKMDVFEFETDHIAIKHGMGTYLMAWSTEVRKKFDHSEYDTNTDGSPNERYMTPETIEKYMAKYPELYAKPAQ